MNKVFNRAKGESFDAYKERAHEAHKRDWIASKQSSGQWLSKSDYEKATGKEGRKR